MTSATIMMSPLLIARCALAHDVVSYNVSQGQHWSHKTKSTNQKKKIWIPLLRSSEGLDIPVMQGRNRRMVKITRVVTGRMRLFEKVNLYAAAKPVEDALVKLGWLTDDAKKYCELLVEQCAQQDAPEWLEEAVCDKGAKIAVEIFDLNDPIQ